MPNFFFNMFTNMQNVREGLKDSLPGTGGGRNPNDALVVKILFSVPVLALLFCYYRSFLQVSNCVITYIQIYEFRFFICGYLDINPYQCWCRHRNTLDPYVEVHFMTKSNSYITKLDPLGLLTTRVFLRHPPLMPAIRLGPRLSFFFGSAEFPFIFMLFILKL